jgi:L-2-hydroxyglutarate oxidase
LDNFDVIIIGAGIIGLASAYRILETEPSLKLCILEKEGSIAMHQSGHNSNVIHSGIYYKPGSLKALNCIAGYSMMIDFCQTHDVPYQICGKMVVATCEEELDRLMFIYNRGKQNNLNKIQLLSREELQKREPNIRGEQAIFVPYTGITDFKMVSKTILNEILSKGGKIHFKSRVEGVKKGEIHNVVTSSGNFSAKYIINCAGLYSDIVTKHFLPDISIRILPFRGEYYWVNQTKRSSINSLIYPVPDPEFPFLGIHLTKTISGNIEAGPNAVPAFRREGYRKSDIELSEFWNFISYKGTRKLFRKYWRTGLKEIRRSFSKSAFTNEIKKFMPTISKHDLKYAGSGVRAQACDKEGNTLDDFVIYETEHSINVCNAPSPAATSSLSIGQLITDKLMNKINH